MPATPLIRSYVQSDLSGLYDVCVRTADAGGDARGTYRDDRLMGDIFAAPYATLEPRHTHVLDDGSGTVVGYVLGTADTGAFVRRYRQEWIPRLADRFPPPADPPVSPDDAMIGLHLHPERMLLPVLDDFPAHLHIDLLPHVQGVGWGRRLMAAFLDGLRADGVGGVHLGMLATNVGALAFYERVGFHRLSIENEPDVIYLARDTAPLPC